ncbi:hypothetical protein L7F22_002720 [Adiantum nelumboides]|nr:hypothetical protein [Adiantum nelumboides]
MRASSPVPTTHAAFSIWCEAPVHSYSAMDTCFFPSTRAVADAFVNKLVPSVVFHFEGADFEITPQNLLIRLSRMAEDPRLCLHFHPDRGSRSVLGSLQQQRTRFIFDPQNSRVAFAQNAC